ncbi:NACHT domain-containing protein [Streptosporangium canum]|uniref:NACHT domain-containing protein n=1 Tax=Streptosporangium canum TaxID=324952 RepID=UPI00343DEE5F
MRNLWRRSRTSTRLGLISIGLTTLLSGSIYLIVAAGGPDWLTTVANISQIIGLPLAVVSIVVPSVIARRSTVPEPVRVALARQVHQQECQVRAALLRGVIAADLSFDDTDPAAVGYSADRGRDGDGREPEGSAVARWVSKKAAGLLFWQETDPVPPGDDAGGPPAGQGTLAGVAGYFSALPDRRLIIVGERGSGKTMLVIQMVIDLNQAILDDSAAGGPVAIRLSAASWPTGRPPADWLADQLVLGYAMSRQEAARLVAEHAVLPILDGLDEMDPDPVQTDGGSPAAGSDPAPDGQGDVLESQGDVLEKRDAAPVRAAALIEELNRFYTGAVFGPVVVTTRPGRHTELIERGLLLEHARQITIQPLTVPQITDYLHRRYRYQPRRHHAWQAVLDRLDHPGHEGVREFLSTPWRLILATSAIDHDPGQAAQLVPHTDRHSTETAAQTRRRLEGSMLADFIPAATALTPRGRGSYTPEQVERWLTALARHLRWQADYLRHHPAPSGMSEVDIVPHLLWPIGGRLLTRLLHTTALLVGIVVVAALVLTPFPPAPWPDETPRWVLGAVLGGTFLPLFLFRTEWPAPHVTMRHISAPALQAGLGGGLMSGLMIVGLAAIGSVFDTVRIDLVVMAVFGIVGGPVGGLVFGLMGGQGSWNPSADLVSPRQAVHRDLMFGLASGLVLGIVGGLVGGPFGFVFGFVFVMLASFASAQGFGTSGESGDDDHFSAVITIAVGFGLMVALGAVVDPPMGIRADLGAGLWSGLVGGLVLAPLGSLTVGSGGAYYAIGIMLAALRGRLPWRFAAFCQWACQAGLLRVAGTGYQFRHRELQSWLTDHR